MLLKRNNKTLLSLVLLLLSSFQMFAQTDSLTILVDSLRQDSTITAELETIQSLLPDSVPALKQDSLSADSISVTPDSIPDIPAFEIVMELSPAPRRGSSQGGSCYGDYYVVATSNNSQFNLFDLKKKSYICTIPVSEPTPNKTIHANTISFSKTFYRSSDELPLLYVCSSFGDSINDQSHLYVYRLKREGASNFSSQLIQDITFGFRGWTECVLDNENSVIWVKKYFKKLEIEFLKFAIPDLSQSKVTLSLNEAQDTICTYEIPTRTQGFLFHDQHIYAVVGVPTSNDCCYFIDFNLVTRDYDRFTSLYDLGMVNAQKKRDNKWEPENIFIYQDEFYIGYHGFICRLNMEKVKEEHNYKTLFERAYN